VVLLGVLACGCNPGGSLSEFWASPPKFLETPDGWVANRDDKTPDPKTVPECPFIGRDGGFQDDTTDIRIPVSLCLFACKSSDEDSHDLSACYIARVCAVDGDVGQYVSCEYNWH
jgi:hypothetical protein